MKTVLTLAVGFWIGRQLYINFDKKEARLKEQKIKKRLQQFLEDNGLTVKEANETTNELIEG